MTMTNADFDSALATLGLQPDEAAPLLGVTTRTIRRWQDGEGIPMTAAVALRAWLTLHEWGIPWRPDTVSVVNDDRDQIRLAREHAIDLNALLDRVHARGGPRHRWTVNFANNTATFNAFGVSFYNLANGGFSLSMYSRRDHLGPDRVRDAEHIEDAAYWIAEAYRNRSAKAGALRALADYTRKNSGTYAQWGPVHSPKQRATHIEAINGIADQLDELASGLAEVASPRRDYGAMLVQLQNLGFFPDPNLVSEAARAFTTDD